MLVHVLALGRLGLLVLVLLLVHALALALGRLRLFLLLRLLLALQPHVLRALGLDDLLDVGVVPRGGQALDVRLPRVDEGRAAHEEEVAYRAAGRLTDADEVVFRVLGHGLDAQRPHEPAATHEVQNAAAGLGAAGRLAVEDAPQEAEELRVVLDNETALIELGVCHPQVLVDAEVEDERQRRAFTAAVVVGLAGRAAREGERRALEHRLALDVGQHVDRRAGVDALQRGQRGQQLDDLVAAVVDAQRRVRAGAQLICPLRLRPLRLRLGLLCLLIAVCRAHRALVLCKGRVLLKY